MPDPDVEAKIKKLLEKDKESQKVHLDPLSEAVYNDFDNCDKDDFKSFGDEMNKRGKKRQKKEYEETEFGNFFIYTPTIAPMAFSG